MLVPSSLALEPGPRISSADSEHIWHTPSASSRNMNPDTASSTKEPIRSFGSMESKTPSGKKFPPRAARALGSLSARGISGTVLLLGSSFEVGSPSSSLSSSKKESSVVDMAEEEAAAAEEEEEAAKAKPAEGSSLFKAAVGGGSAAGGRAGAPLISAPSEALSNYGLKAC